MPRQRTTPTPSAADPVRLKNQAALRRVPDDGTDIVRATMEPWMYGALEAVNFGGGKLARFRLRALGRTIRMLREVRANVDAGAEIVPALNEEHSVDGELLVAQEVQRWKTDPDGPRWIHLDLADPQPVNGEVPIRWPVPEFGVAEHDPHRRPTGAVLAAMNPMCLGTAKYISAQAVCTLLDVTPAGGGQTVLAFVVDRMPHDLGRSRVILMTDRQSETNLNRVPAVLDLATRAPVDADVETVQVDGEPFASPAPLTRYRAPSRRNASRHQQRVLPGFPGPRTLNGRGIGNIVLSALSQLPLPGDERSRLRDDIARLGELAFALARPALIPEKAGASFLGGSVTTANVARFWEAAEVLRSLTIKIDAVGRWLSIASVDTLPTEGVVYLRPPNWWHGVGKHNAYRLSGGLWRPVLDGNQRFSPAAALSRIVAGLEARLCWSQPAGGRGKYGRIPGPLVPTRKGGPGSPVFVPWTELLTLAGEVVPPDVEPTGTERRRYNRRVDALVEAGYLLTSPNAPIAKRGDTVEIVKVIRGGRGRVTGLLVRASQRFCSAVVDHLWARVPAEMLFRRER